MSLLFITVNDFKGEINLDLTNDSNVITQFEAFAESVVYEELNDLFNSKLYNDLIADLTNGTPVTQKYIDLVDGKAYLRPSGETVNYQGIKKMLRYFVYDQYLDFIWSQNTSVGQMNSNNENSTNLSRSDLRKVRQRIQHKAVDLYIQAVKFINDNYSDYFSGSDYGFWQPKQKTYLGSIISVTPRNEYFANKSSEGN